MRYFTVKQLRDELDHLVERGMGERAVSFSMVCDDEGYDGDFVLVDKVDTKDALETAIYLLPPKPEVNNFLWDEIEEEGNRRLEEEDE